MRFLVDAILAFITFLDVMLVWRLLRWCAPHFRRFSEKLADTRKADGGFTQRVFWHDTRYLYARTGAALGVVFCYAVLMSIFRLSWLPEVDIFSMVCIVVATLIEVCGVLVSFIPFLFFLVFPKRGRS